MSTLTTLKSNVTTNVTQQGSSDRITATEIRAVLNPVIDELGLRGVPQVVNTGALATLANTETTMVYVEGVGFFRDTATGPQNGTTIFDGVGGRFWSKVIVSAADVGLGNVNNTSDANKPVSTLQAAADAAVLVSANAYTDSLVTTFLDDRGNYNASGNVFPSTGGSGSAGAVLKGDLWTISVAGTLGGTPVTVGDVVRSLINAPGQTAGNWVVTENNIGYVAENNANKSNDGTMAANSSTLFPTQAAVRTYVAANAGGSQTLQQVYTAGTTLTGNNTITGAEYTLTENSVRRVLADGKALIGNRINYSWATNPVTGWTDSTPNTTVTPDGTKTTFAGGNNTVSNRLIRTGVYIGVQNWTVRQRIVVKDKSATSYGISFRILPGNVSAPPLHVKFSLDTTTGYISDGASLNNQNAPAFVWAQDDRLDLYIIRRGPYLLARMTNVENGMVSELVIPILGIGVGIPEFDFWGGTWEFTGSLTVSYDEVQRPAIAAIGDSITDAAGVTHRALSWFDIATEGVIGGTSRMSAGFENTADGVLRLDDLTNWVKPEAIVIAYGVNDVNIIGSTATFNTNLRAIVQALVDMPEPVEIILCTISPQATDVTAYNTIINQVVTDFALAPAVKVFEILKNSGNNQMNPLYLYDAVHENSLGHSIFGNAVKNKLIDRGIKFGSPIQQRSIIHSNRYRYLAGFDEEGKLVAIADGINPNYIRNILYVDGFTNYQRADLFVNGSAAWVTPAGGRFIITGNGNLAAPNLKLEAGVFTLATSFVCSVFSIVGGQPTISGNWMQFTSGAFIRATTNLPLILKSNINPGTGTAAVVSDTEGAGAASPAAGFRLHSFRLDGVEKAGFLTGGGLLLGSYTTTEKNALAGANLLERTLIYDTDLNKVCFYNGTAWETITSA